MKLIKALVLVRTSKRKSILKSQFEDKITSLLSGPRFGRNTFL